MIGWSAMALVVSAAYAGRSVELPIPVPHHLFVPNFESIALAPEVWDECNQQAIVGWQEGMTWVRKDQDRTEFQDLALRNETPSWTEIRAALRSIRISEVRSSEQAKRLGEALGVDMVAWGKPTFRRSESGDTWVSTIIWELVEVESGVTVAKVKVDPQRSGLLYVFDETKEAGCHRLGLMFPYPVLPQVADETYTLAKDNRIKELYEPFSEGRIELVRAQLVQMEREDPSDLLVQFNLGVIDEIYGNLDGAAVRYGWAEGVPDSVLEDAQERLEFRRQQVSQLQGYGYHIALTQTGGPRQVHLAPGAEPGSITHLLIESDPPGAEVFIGAADHGTTPVEIHGLEPGAVLVTLVLEEYAPETSTVDLEVGQSIRSAVTLSKDRGGILVRALPGSEVVLSGEMYEVDADGVVEIANLVVGEHSIRVILDGHMPVPRTVSVQSGHTTEVDVKQAVSPSKLVVRGVPGDALIAIDGRDVRGHPDKVRYTLGTRSRAELRLAAGRHAIEVSAPGFEPFHQDVELAAGQSLELQYELMPEGGPPPTSGDLVLNIQPTGTVVWLGDTPYDAQERHMLEGLSIGDHAIKVTHPDYQSWEGKVEITGEPDQSVNVQLQPMAGRVLVISQPVGADVWIGGTEVGATPYTGELPVGETTIVVRKSGYADGEREMDILPNRDHRVNVVLEVE